MLSVLATGAIETLRVGSLALVGSSRDFAPRTVVTLSVRAFL